MLNTMCLTSLHNIQQDLINFIPGFSSLLMQMIFFLLLKQTVPNSDTRYFRASVIYMYTNPMVMYELMRIRHMAVFKAKIEIWKLGGTVYVQRRWEASTSDLQHGSVELLKNHALTENHLKNHIYRGIIPS